MLIKNVLISKLNSNGYWEGKLSSSALSTATAIFAISLADFDSHKLTVRSGLEWLVKNINEDGGYGDTPDSESNLSTSLLVWAAMSISEKFETDFSPTISKLENYIKTKTGSLEPEFITEALLKHYGKDRTFSVPILVMCASAGRLGQEPKCWKLVPQLPFELSILPHSLFKIIRLPVVSYAMPALITMGILRHKMAPTWCPVTRFIRWLSQKKAMEILSKIQPVNGGFLEATPLTSFVTMSLVKAGFPLHDVVAKSIKFLLKSCRDDGSWPIDTNLSTWLTTLSVKALPEDALSVNQKTNIRQWLLRQQYKEIHPYTNAAPGGWAWTDLPGGTPDADDTAGVIIALKKLIPNFENKDKENSALNEIKAAVIKGIEWLIGLQNKDGGIPTFCQGWGKLPFDRSCPDITSHALKAFALWQDELPESLQDKIHSANKKMLKYLQDNQCKDGSWIPLWFGNQHHPEKINPIYGTAQVLIGLQPFWETNLSIKKSADKGFKFLRNSQNPDNGWGVKIKSSESITSETVALSFQSSIEETALAVAALASSKDPADKIAVQEGMEYIKSESKNEFKPSPIGLYFASLWYSEELYPIIFAMQAEDALKK